MLCTKSDEGLPPFVRRLIDALRKS